MDTLRDSVSKVHALAMQTYRKHLAMETQLDAMKREAFQTYQDILEWPSHKTYLEEEDRLANEVQSLYQTGYRASVAEELVGGVQEKLGGVRHSVWTNLMCTAGECRVSTSPWATTSSTHLSTGPELLFTNGCCLPPL